MPTPGARRAVAARYERLGVPALVEATGEGDGAPAGFLRVWRGLAAEPLVSVVVPTAGGRRELRGRDTVRILDGVSHAQVSAPGYAMYYIWIVRHLPGNPYTGFHFDPEHEWVLDPSRQGWRPAEGPA